MKCKKSLLAGLKAGKQLFIVFVLIIGTGSHLAFSQTTAFNFQGKLNDGATPASGTYEMQFKLFDALTGGNQIGGTITDASVVVVNGSFASTLDFGAAAFGTGSDRFLEISVRPSGSTNPFTILAPLQQVKSAPYSIQSKNAAAADSLSAACVSCVTSGQIQSVDGGQITGTLPVTTVPTGSDNYIQNAAIPRSGRILGGQPTASFDVGSGNVSGLMTVGGQLGVGTAAPEAGYKLDVSGYTIFRPTGPGTGGKILFTVPNGETGMSIQGTNRADLRFNDSVFSFTAGTGLGVPSNFGVIVNTSGEVGINKLPSTGLKLDVGGVGRFSLPSGTVQFGSPNSETGITISGTNRADIRFNNSILTLAAGAGVGVPGNTGISVKTDGNVGIGTTNPTNKLEVVGTLKTDVLQISGGSDLAENFEVAAAVKPGMVVAIDPGNAGKLTLARGAYNRRVVGVISGANNLSAGMVLPNLDQKIASMPVALSGRVWVYADATNGPITAGDLLTTSVTPGHAMKVTNFKRANGAVIGKALTSLKAGTGLVLVVVNLQ